MVFLVGPKGFVNKFLGDLMSLFFTRIFNLSVVQFIFCLPPLSASACIINIKLFSLITPDRFKEVSNNLSTCQISQVSGFFVYIYQSRQANRYLADYN